MKRISNNHITLSRQDANQVLSELRATGIKLSQRPYESRTNCWPAQFVSEASTARYLTEKEARTRWPLTATLSGGDETIRFCESHFRHITQQSLQEEFYVLTLDGAHRVIRTHSITVGLANSTQVHPREVFRPAIVDAAIAIIALHNHPSGDSKPSPADQEVTKRLAEAGKLLGIPLLDHIILAREGSLSLREYHDELFRA